MTVAFGLLLGAKLLLLLLFSAVDLPFYRSDGLAQGILGEGDLVDLAASYTGYFYQTYKQTFWLGWRLAITNLPSSQWLGHALLTLLAVGGAAACIAARDASDWLTRRQALLGFVCGASLVLPAVGILIWLPNYRLGWRMYFLVPIGASIANVCLLVLVTSPLHRRRLRHAVFVGLCLLLLFPAIARLNEIAAGHARNADAKARILWQIMQEAPAVRGSAALLLHTDRGVYALREQGVSELSTNMFDASLYLLYGEGRPRFSLLCYNGHRCHADTVESFDLRQVDDFSDIILFRLHDDLRVELLRELPPELGIVNAESYQPERHIDFDAPLPTRAITMLGMTRD